jgi:putative protease
MAEEKVGKVVKFFTKPSVAAIEITDGTLAVGDNIKIKGHTTDFEGSITSMQEENKSIETASPGQMIGIKVKGRVREHDIVYKITE